MKIVLSVLLLALCSRASLAAPGYFYDDDARFIYQLLKDKGATEVDTPNGNERALRVSAAQVLCLRFLAPGEEGRPEPVFRCELNLNGDPEPYIIGGRVGGDRLHAILSRLTGMFPHPSVQRLQCVKFVNGSNLTYGCGVSR